MTLTQKEFASMGGKARFKTEEEKKAHIAMMNEKRLEKMAKNKAKTEGVNNSVD